MAVKGAVARLVVTLVRIIDTGGHWRLHPNDHRRNMTAEPVADSVVAPIDRLRHTLRQHTLMPEQQAVAAARMRIGLPADALSGATLLARELVTGARARAGERTYFDAFLQEFGLSNREGIALMSLAESLLRVPDAPTADRLIREKLSSGDWSAHTSGSTSGFVNASTFGLTLAGKILGREADAQEQGGPFAGLMRRLGEPVVRQAMQRAMKLMGGEFVVGRTIEEALSRARKEDRLALCSFDMLGEGARTDADALRYFKSYQHAIATIAAQVKGSPIRAAHSISIKLSALDPVYSRTKTGSVHARLIPRTLELTRQAARLGLGLTIDAEEADRLDISLDVIGGVDPRSGDARLAGSGVGSTSLWQACGRHDRVGRCTGAFRQASDDHAGGEGRVLGQRDQTRAGAWSQRLSGVHQQAAHRHLVPGCGDCLVRRHGCDLSAVCDPQCHDDCRDSATAPDWRGLRIPAAPWHGRVAVQRSGAAHRTLSTGARVCPGGCA